MACAMKYGCVPFPRAASVWAVIALKTRYDSKALTSDDSESVHVYRFFLKEGVVHAMEQLAATAPKDEPKQEPKDPAPKSRTPPLRRSSSRLKVCHL